MKTDEFKEFAHFRNGVEALVSLLKINIMWIKYLHIKKQTRIHFGFKVAALNFQKLLNYENSLVYHASENETA